jgi:hypothetical protein
MLQENYIGGEFAGLTWEASVARGRTVSWGRHAEKGRNEEGDPAMN